MIWKKNLHGRWERITFLNQTELLTYFHGTMVQYHGTITVSWYLHGTVRYLKKWHTLWYVLLVLLVNKDFNLCFFPPQKTISLLFHGSFHWNHVFTKTSTRSQTSIVQCANDCITYGYVCSYFSIFLQYSQCISFNVHCGVCTELQSRGFILPLLCHFCFHCKHWEKQTQEHLYRQVLYFELSVHKSKCGVSYYSCVAV